MTNPGRPLFDMANTAIQVDALAMLDIGKVPLPGGGEIGFATIRLGNATLSVPLNKETAGVWSDLLGQLRDMLSGSGLVTAVKAPLAVAVKGQHT